MDFSAKHRDLLRQIQDQLLIVLINQMGGKDVQIKWSDLRSTEQLALAFRFDEDNQIFHFDVVPKRSM